MEHTQYRSREVKRVNHAMEQNPKKVGRPQRARLREHHLCTRTQPHVREQEETGVVLYGWLVCSVPGPACSLPRPSNKVLDSLSRSSFLVFLLDSNKSPPASTEFLALVLNTTLTSHEPNIVPSPIRLCWFPSGVVDLRPTPITSTTGVYKPRSTTAK